MQTSAESVWTAGKQMWWRVDVDEQKFVEFFDDYVILTGIYGKLDIKEPEQQKNNGKWNYI